jgi:RNA polymerase sigma-70 factor (ECF subfamily)
MKQRNATELLNRACGGEMAAAAELLPLVYDELRALAESYFRHERRDHTLQPTALVHEAYSRLVDQSSIEWRSQHQFFALASRAMRNILVDHARTRDRAKRGGGVQTLSLEEVASKSNDVAPIDILALEDAISNLAQLDPRKASLVELRYFGGLTLEDAAAVLGVSRATASEEWRLARALLHRALRESTP